MPHNSVTAIMHGERSITATMAIRLSKAFGITAQRLNLQSIYDLKRARAELPQTALDRYKPSGRPDQVAVLC